MWQVMGQDKNLALLDRSLKESSIAHAYLLVGPHHVGKRTLALNLAQALNCDDLEPPCGQCRSCRRIHEGKHADVIPIGLNSKTEISIDDVREAQRLANLPPYEGRCKVFIVHDAEYLSNEASNALLKILEEPPPKVVWLLLACEERRLLPTVVSRCHRLELKPMPVKQIERVLVDSCGTPEQAKLLARLSCGCLGWALSAAANDKLLKQRFERIDKLTSLLHASLQQRFTCAQELAREFSRDRRTAAEVMQIWLGLWHDFMLTKCSYEEAITNIDYAETVEAYARQLTLVQIKDFIARLYSATEDISKNVNALLTLEVLMLDMPRKERMNGQASRGSFQTRR